MREFFFATMAAAALCASAGNSSDVWGDAQWIGSGDGPALYAQYLPVFRLDCGLESDGGDCAVFFGANDERLQKAFLNQGHVVAGPGESYFALEFSGGKARLMRRNIAADENKPVLVAEADFELPSGHHELTLRCSLGNVTVDVDGRRIISKGVNPYGNGSDYVAYPVLADVGVCARGKAQADFTARSFRSPEAVLARVSATADGDTAFVSFPQRGLPALRSTLRVTRPLKKATLKSTARGIYTAKINGRTVGNEYFAPGASQYNRTHYYNITDITPLLTEGDNTIDVQLGEGWWCGPSTYVGDNYNFFGDRPSFISNIVLEYADGTTDTVPGRADEWLCATDGPLQVGSFFQGEVYDSQRRPTWQAAAVVETDGTVPLESHGSWPMPGDYSRQRFVEAGGTAVKAVDTLTAVAVSSPAEGVYIYDMGQNFAGVPLITFRGLRPGQTASMRFAEVLYPDMPQYAGHAGEMMMENIRSAMSQDRFTSSGSGIETFSPTTTFHGYRYVEISGVDEPLPTGDVRGIALSSVPSVASTFECSDSSLNRLWENVLWSTRANFLSIPTDCPQRNERMGWSGDISVFTPTANYLTDGPEFLKRHTQNLRDCQRPDGRFPDIAPTGFGFGGLLWGSAGIVLPYEIWRHYGDTGVLRDNYEAMKQYMSYVTDDYIDPVSGLLVQHREWGDLGDWLSPEHDRNDKSLLWEAYYIRCLGMMVEMAAELGEEADAKAYGELKERRTDFFRSTYIDPVTHKTRFSAFVPEKEGEEVGTQVSYVLPIAFGIVDPKKDKAFIDNFLATLRSGRVADDGRRCPDHSLMTGFIGTAEIMNALTAAGADEEAYRLLTQHAYPSWLYPVDQGATTIWERLNSYTLTDGFGGNNGMNSFNHYSFGAVGQWLIEHCAGIGYTREGIVIAPVVDRRSDGLTSARATYRSPKGLIASGWRKEGDSIVYEIEIPDGTGAVLRLPGEKDRKLKSGKHTISKTLR